MTLRLAVSNIAWDPSEDDAIAAVLRRENVPAIELAPTKWRADAFTAPTADVQAFRRAWNDRGLEIVSLQSLLFGRPELQLFGDAAVRQAMIDFLCRTLDFASAVGAGAVVYGSPKNRVRGEIALADAMRIAADVLRDVGAHAAERGVRFCVEANPPGYGCDFVRTTREAIELCKLVDHPAVVVNGDLGGMTMSGEDPRTSIELAGARLGHFHASEPNLVELGAEADHVRAAEGLAAIRYPHWVSIEMRAADGGRRTADGANIAAVTRAVQRAKAAYQRLSS